VSIGGKRYKQPDIQLRIIKRYERMKLRYEEGGREEDRNGKHILIYSTTSLYFQSSTEHPHRSLPLTRAGLLLEGKRVRSERIGKRTSPS